MKSVMFQLNDDEKHYTITGSEKDRSIIGTIESNKGLYEPYVVKLLKDIIRPEWTCLDIGANIGVISMVLSRYASAGTVYSFEPSINNYKYLKLNVNQNQATNVVPVNLGIYDKQCEINFSYVEEVAGCSFISSQGIAEGITEKIHCTTLDQWVRENDIRQINFIKMDVEGSEIKAINGSLKSLRDFKPDMIIEFNPGPIVRFSGDDPEKLYEQISTIYPHVYLINDKNGSLIRIDNYPQLLELIKQGKGWEDLFCTFSQ